MRFRGFTARLLAVVVIMASRALTANVSRAFYAAPFGKSDAAGSKAEPWDLRTALAQPSSLRPGDVLLLRGGVYGIGTTVYESRISGAPEMPIVVRQYPGERATINGGLIVRGSNAWYWGFEVTSLLTDRTGGAQANFSGAPEGVTVLGEHIKLINLVIHDSRDAIGLWMPAIDAEAYGCILFHNGWQGPDRGHGHGIYTQNGNGTKTIADNIIFEQFDHGIQAFVTDTTKGSVKGYVVDGNVLFNNGGISRDGYSDNILFGYSGAMADIHISNNYTFYDPAANKGGSHIGWQFSGRNRNAIVKDNYFIGGYFSVELWSWDTLAFTGNTVYSQRASVVDLQLAAQQSAQSYSFANNQYYGEGQFYFRGQRLTWSSWKKVSGLDAQSRFAQGAPSGVWQFVRPNKYEPRRGHVVIYNWDKMRELMIDLSPIVKDGTRFQIRDVQNYFGPPVARGVYQGGYVRISLDGLKAMPPVGLVPNPPAHTAPLFAVLIVLPDDELITN